MDSQTTTEEYYDDGLGEVDDGNDYVEETTQPVEESTQPVEEATSVKDVGEAADDAAEDGGLRWIPVPVRRIRCTLDCNKQYGPPRPGVPILDTAEVAFCDRYLCHCKCCPWEVLNCRDYIQDYDGEISYKFHDGKTRAMGWKVYNGKISCDIRADECPDVTRERRIAEDLNATREHNKKKWEARVRWLHGNGLKTHVSKALGVTVVISFLWAQFM